MLTAAAAGLVSHPGGVRAEEPGMLENDFFLAAGAYAQDSDVDVELNGEGAAGDKVDLDATFGANDANRLRADGFWHFGERHKLRAMWFAAKIDRSGTTDRDIQWGDELYPAGTSVSLEREFSIYELAYEYAFTKRERWEFAGSVGVHYARFSAQLAANVNDPGQPGGTRYASSTARMRAPLPVIGLHGTWNPRGHFWIDGGAQLFALSFDEYDGSLVNYRLAAIWQPKTWFGLGAGYDVCVLDLDVDAESFNGSIEWTYKGPQVFMSAVF